MRARRLAPTRARLPVWAGTILACSLTLAGPPGRAGARTDGMSVAQGRDLRDELPLLHAARVAPLDGFSSLAEARARGLDYQADDSLVRGVLEALASLMGPLRRLVGPQATLADQARVLAQQADVWRRLDLLFSSATDQPPPAQALSMRITPDPLLPISYSHQRFWSLIAEGLPAFLGAYGLFLHLDAVPIIERSVRVDTTTVHLDTTRDAMIPIFSLYFIDAVNAPQDITVFEDTVRARTIEVGSPVTLVTSEREGGSAVRFLARPPTEPMVTQHGQLFLFAAQLDSHVTGLQSTGFFDALQPPIAIRLGITPMDAPVFSPYAVRTLAGLDDDYFYRIFPRLLSYEALATAHAAVRDYIRDHLPTRDDLLGYHRRHQAMHLLLAEDTTFTFALQRRPTRYDDYAHDRLNAIAHEELQADLAALAAPDDGSAVVALATVLWHAARYKERESRGALHRLAIDAAHARDQAAVFIVDRLVEAVAQDPATFDVALRDDDFLQKQIEFQLHRLALAGDWRDRRPNRANLARVREIAAAIRARVEREWVGRSLILDFEPLSEADVVRLRSARDTSSGG